MAFNPSASPAVVTREIDLSGVVPGITSPAGAMVGDFSWGPVDSPILVNSEGVLVQKFGAPEATNSVDFHSAAYYLKYSTDLHVVRAVSSAAKNAFSGDSGTGAPTIKNEANFEGQQAALESNGVDIAARYPGTLGNSLKVVAAGVANFTSQFDSGQQAQFTAAPDSNEIHVLVIDEDGEITGTAGEVLETWEFLSTSVGAKTTDGSDNYVTSVINNGSQWIHVPGTLPTTTNVSLAAGVNSATLGTSEILSGHDLFEDVDTITVDFLIAPSMASAADHRTVVNDLIATAQGVRKDCMVVASPNRSAIVNNAGSEVTDTTAALTGLTRSSYLSVDNNFLKVYDKYNDQYIQIPAASSTAGIMAATAVNAAPWFSPAGSRRGQYLGVTSLAYSPSKVERDTLYKAGINPVANIPGEGILLYGDKTHLSRPSAFDRINVRRLFLTIERSIAAASKNILFEFNDEFTRAEFVSIVEPFLREIQGGRGITDFKVVCDETNNTAAVVDRNEFVANIFIKPARSINYITLNFVAVRTGVEFEEVVGRV
jgi:hypothetical protein